jgi:hypothetical protein
MEQPRNLSAEYTATLKYDIQIACSTVQGNIVIGHTTNYEVGPENAQYLRRLSRKLAADLNSDIQLEFVIDKRYSKKNSTVTRAKNKAVKLSN